MNDSSSSRKKPLRIGNAQGFWGDSIDAPLRLVQQDPTLDVLTLDYLAEVSMSILAIQQQKDSTAGYARDFLDVVRSLIPQWKKGSKLKIVTNAGGLNPQGCAKACLELLKEHQCPLTIGVVSGDGVLDLLKSAPNSASFSHLETHEPLSTVLPHLTTANAYLGAKPLVEALNQGADIVLTGRVTDPSLTVAPCIAHFGWSWTDYDQIAGATIAGHLIECGTQVTGGISTDWLVIDNPAEIGFPIVEVYADGSCVVTKPAHTAGCVTIQTVKEQLLYEIGDPDHFIGPDVITSFLSLQLTEDGPNRIRLTGAKGKTPPSTYKVSATYQDGFRAEGILAIFGRNARTKAQKSGEIILQRLKRSGVEPERFLIECLGSGDIVPGILSKADDTLMECVLRVSAADPKKEIIERFSKELAPLVTSGAPGTTGYTSGRPHVRPIYGYWPCLIPKDQVKPNVEIWKGTT